MCPGRNAPVYQFQTILVRNVASPLVGSPPVYARFVTGEVALVDARGARLERVVLVSVM